MRHRLAAAIVFAAVLAGQSAIPPEVRGETNPARRADKALTLAEQDFDSANQLYNKGDVHKGDAALDEMTTALHICLDSLDAAHKAALWKKAELRVALLQRRMRSLLEDIGVEQRGWAEYTDRKVDEIHDKMLEGVMQR